MWPVIIKEGIVILMAGAMLVAGSLNIYNAPEHGKKVVYHVNPNKEIEQIERDFKNYHGDFYDYVHKGKFEHISDKAIKKMREKLPKDLQEIMPKNIEKDIVVYEYLRHRFILNK